VQTENATRTLLVGDAEVTDAVQVIEEVSGVHWSDPPGIFIAAGPDIRVDAAPDDLDIHDVASTLLYAMGLPVAADAAGRPRRELFTPEFRRAFPVQTVESWGRWTGGEPLSSTHDRELLEELRSLGYID
jgi:hypothetical protein